MNIITIVSTIFMVIKISVMGVILMLLELMVAMRNISTKCFTCIFILLGKGMYTDFKNKRK